MTPKEIKAAYDREYRKNPINRLRKQENEKRRLINPEALAHKKLKAQEHHKIYYARPEVRQRLKAGQLKYMANPVNAAKVKAQAFQWRKNHRIEMRARLAQWREENPEKALLAVHKRRSRKLNVVNDLTAQEWEARLAEFNGMCAYCHETDRPQTLDHVLPLIHGGGHTLSNVLPVCQPCNSSKHTKGLLEWASQ